MYRLCGIPERMWVDQPSKSQPLHYLHGQNVLAMADGGSDYARIYFLKGDIVSMRVPVHVLSVGWI